MAAATRAPTAENRPAGAQRDAEERGKAPLVVNDGKNNFIASLKDAAGAALLAGVLGFFFLALRTEIAPGGLDVSARWGLWLTAIAVVFGGRLLLNLFVFKADRPVTRVFSGSGAAVGARMPWLGKALGYVLLAIAVTLPFLITTLFPGQQRQLIDLAILIMTYVMLGWGLNIVVGLAGLLDLGYVAFYAVGAYSFALLSTHFELIGFWTALPLAGALAAFWGIILGFPVLRLRGDYLAIVTLAFGEIIRIILLNWYEFTGGPNGISGIPKPTFFGMEFSRGDDGVAAFLGIEYSTIHRFIYLYYIIFILAIVTNLVTIRLRRLPVGRAWEALREDEIACRSLGINTTSTKLTAFAIGAMFGGFAGAFFAARQGFVSPESFIFLESAIILAIVVLGGMGSLTGIAIAAVVMIGGTEILRELHFLKAVFGPNFTPELYRMLLFGMAMVIVMIWKPRGFVGSREPTAFLHERKAVSSSFTKEGHG